MAVTVGKKPKAAAKKAKALTFTIDCSKPVDDKIMEISSFEKFLEQKIKVRARVSRP
jgi:large subunit ribosomal protein L22e